MVTCFIAGILSISTMGFVVAKQLFPGTRDIRFIQAINDHAIAEYKRLVTDPQDTERDTVEY